MNKKYRIEGNQTLPVAVGEQVLLEGRLIVQTNMTRVNPIILEPLYFEVKYLGERQNA